MRTTAPAARWRREHPLQHPLEQPDPVLVQPDDARPHDRATPAAGQPDSVTIAGSLQSELGCASDWDPTCAATHLTYDANDTVWRGTFMPAAGDYEYKAALDDSWDENYGLHATLSRLNIPLAASGGSVKFLLLARDHQATDNVNSVIATAPGDYQSELGCSGDWDPSCLRSWLQDPRTRATFGICKLEATLPAGATRPRRRSTKAGTRTTAPAAS